MCLDNVVGDTVRPEADDSLVSGTRVSHSDRVETDRGQNFLNFVSISQTDNVPFHIGNRNHDEKFYVHLKFLFLCALLFS